MTNSQVAGYTGIFTFAFGVVYLYLSLRVALMRGNIARAIGFDPWMDKESAAKMTDDQKQLLVKGEERLNRANRVHGNFQEYVPICLLMMFLMEYNQAQTEAIWIPGIVLFLARLAHAFGLGGGCSGNMSAANPFRGFGITVTFLYLLYGSVYNLYLAIYSFYHTYTFGL